MSHFLRFKPFTDKPLPLPLRLLLNPVVLVALGLHALLLFYPFGGEKKPQPAATKKDEAVKLTQLSKSSAPKPRPKIQRQLPKTNRPKPPIAAPKPPAPDGGGQSNPLADFPHYPGAQPDCFGNTGESCYFTNSNIGAVTAHFAKALPAAKFKVETDTDTATDKVYVLTKGPLKFYLSVLADPPQTVYFLASNKVTRDQLAKIKAGKVAQIPAELQTLLDAVTPPTQGTETYDATPIELGGNAQFFFQPDPDFPSNQVTLAGIYSTRIAQGRSEADILTEARTRFESVTPAGSYGGGTLYQIKKGSFIGYLNIVPSPIGSPIVVIWTQKPN